MRITIRGGVWKNTEDEILKAAVMKYGLNAWSRISSLLVRKSAKQCKARWYEWLDPSIKKTEWTREEDEKLLHLAKIMPTQWRTIAPIVGRTPQQCLERYERLLTEAAQGGASQDPRDDPRRMRPGEIDPNPESKPARPDAVDMDEDEKEMLAEARARLANTRGKKAKRKAREQQLEEAKRLSVLQKKRELRAAGVEVGTKLKTKRTIDHSSEVALERRPAPGFFDTSREAERTKTISQEFRPMSYSAAAGGEKKRLDVERALMKADLSHEKNLDAKEKMGRVMTGDSAGAAGDAAQGMASGRRRKMMLPEPAMSERELQQVAKMGEQGEEGGGDDDFATAASAAGIAGGRSVVDMRTPRASSISGSGSQGGTGSGDAIMDAARHLAAMQAAPTPLLGGESVENLGDYSGLTPQRRVVSTPKHVGLAAMATPNMSGLGLAMSTPRTSTGDGSGVIAGSRHRSDQSTLLRASFSALPKPTGKYQIMAHHDAAENMDDDMEMEDGSSGGGMVHQVMDQAEVERRAAERERQRLAEERKKMSTVLKRGDKLPRPSSSAHIVAVEPADDVQGIQKEAAEMVAAEVRRRIDQDAVKYPPIPTTNPSSNKKKKRKNDVSAHTPDEDESHKKKNIHVDHDHDDDDFTVEELQQAGLLLEEEAAELESIMRRRKLQTNNNDQHDHTEDGSERIDVDMWRSLAKDFVYLPRATPPTFKYIPNAAEDDENKTLLLENYKFRYERIRSMMESDRKTVDKLGKKLNTLTAGLMVRHDKLAAGIAASSVSLDKARIEKRCFQVLREQEESAAHLRIEELKNLVTTQEARSKELQKKYAELERQWRDEQQQEEEQKKKKMVAVG